MSQPGGLWHDVRTLNAAANALFALALAATLGVVAYRVASMPHFRLRAVTIEAAPGTELRYVSSSLLRATARGKLDGTFFTVDLHALRRSFDSVPWVRHATVRRIWPDRVVVAIEEHRPFALWNEGQAINTFGELYSANLDEVEESGPMPAFAGPADAAYLVLDRYRELGDWLSPLRLTPVAVTLSPRWAWSAKLSDGTTLLLGREQGLPIEERVRRWVSAYPRVKPRVELSATVIDLRYPNGFAVRSAVAASGKPKAAAANGARKVASR